MSDKPTAPEVPASNDATTPTPPDTAGTPPTAPAAAEPAAATVETTETPAAAAEPAPAPARGPALYSGSLEQEVGQVLKTFGSFWGGFKAKSVSTLSQFKDELDKTATQVQADLKHLQETNVEVVRKDPAEWEAEQAEKKEKERLQAEEDAARREAEAEASSKDKGKGRAVGEVPDDAAPASPTSPTSLTAALPAEASAAATALFSRITSSTSQLSHSLQNTFNTTVASARSNPTLNNPTQLRAQLAENLRLSSARENLTLSLQQAEKLAEEYMKKGGALAKEAERVGGGWVKEAERVGGGWVKEAEKWVEDNVKVVPPTGNETFVPAGGWDAGEWYAFSTSESVPPSPAQPRGSSSETPRPSLSSAAVAGSRKEALLRRLREDKDLLMVDPASEDESQQRRDEFAAWIKNTWDAAKTAGREAEEGNVGEIRMALVPEHLSDEQFWQRYLFHKDMIEAADAKRKQLLEASTQDTADDFSWDDDDDDESAVSPTSAKTPTAAAAGASTTSASATGSTVTPMPASGPPTAASSTGVKSVTTSPRDSEESYDVVHKASGAPTEDDDDSDWE